MASRATRRRLTWAMGIIGVAGILVSIAPRVVGRGLVLSLHAGRNWEDVPRHVELDLPDGANWVGVHAARFPERPFSASWRGWIAVDNDDTFEFVTESDDGSWIYIDNTLVVDNGGAHEVRRADGRVPLTRGPHRIRVDYFQDRGDAELRVSWGRVGRVQTPVPARVLFPTWLAYHANRAWRPGYLWATTVSSSLLVVAGLWMSGHVRRHTTRPEHDPRSTRWLYAILGLAVALVGWQIWYGFPDGFELDELRPREVVPGLYQGFVGGWHDHYPPLYFYVLGVLSLPFTLAGRAGALDLWGLQATVTQALLYRMSALLLGVGVVYLVYRVGVEAFGRRAVGLWAAFVVAVTPNFVYLAKLAKPEMPYLAPCLLAMLAYLRALRAPGAWSYAAFAAAGMLAICTKDQAYGLFVFPAVHLVWRRWCATGGRPSSRLRAFVVDRPLRAAVATAVAVFVVVHNLLFNLSGFLAHVALITGGGSQGFRVYPSTWQGHLAMLADAFAQVPWMFGWPVALAVVAGIPLALRDRRTETLALLTPIASYYVCFIAVIGFQYDRFYLGPATLLAVFAGVALSGLVSLAPWGRLGAAAVAVYSLAYGASVDVLMMRDSRFAAERWLSENVGRAMVGFVGPSVYLPRQPAGVISVDLEPDWEVVDAIGPEFLVVNAEYGQRVRLVGFYPRLLDGRHPDYRLVATFKTPPGLAVLGHDPVFRNGREDDFTNLDKINPEIRVYARRGVEVP